MLYSDSEEFDKGFALTYPKERHLTENFRDGQRVIAELIPANDQIYRQLTSHDFPLFPTRVVGGTRYHDIAPDSRDLSSIIRLSSEFTLPRLGSLFGWRLRGIHNATGQLPADSIIRRFAIHSDSSLDLSSFGGVDATLLPPFDRFERIPNVYRAVDLVLNDLIELDLIETTKRDYFLEGVESGIETIG